MANIHVSSFYEVLQHSYARGTWKLSESLEHMNLWRDRDNINKMKFLLKEVLLNLCYCRHGQLMEVMFCEA